MGIHLSFTLIASRHFVMNRLRSAQHSWCLLNIWMLNFCALMNLSAGKVATAIATAEAMPTTEANGNWNAVYFFLLIFCLTFTMCLGCERLMRVNFVRLLNEIRKKNQKIPIVFSCLVACVSPSQLIWKTEITRSVWTSSNR